MASPYQTDPGGSDDVVDEPEAENPRHYDEPEPFMPEDDGDEDEDQDEYDDDNGPGGEPEFKPPPELMKQMIYQFDRTLGFKKFEEFLVELVNNLQTNITDNSQQPFVRTFTDAGKKEATIMELELARTCNGGYLPEPAMKFASGSFQKWVVVNKAELTVLNGRPQPKPQPQDTKVGTTQEHSTRSELANNLMAPAQDQSVSKVGPNKSKTTLCGVANAECGQKLKKRKKDDDGEEGNGGTSGSPAAKRSH